MKTINLKQTIKDINGKDVTQMVPVKKQSFVDNKMVEDEVMEPVTMDVYSLFKIALLRREGVITEEEVVKRYNLFNKINGQDSVKLTKDEIEFIKELSLNRFDVFFTGQLFEILKI